MTQNLVKCVKYLTFLFLGYPHPLTAQFSNSTAKCHDMTPGTAHVWYIVNVQMIVVEVTRFRGGRLSIPSGSLFEPNCLLPYF